MGKVLRPHERWLARRALSLRGASLTILIYHRVLAEPDAMRTYECDVAQFCMHLDVLTSLFTVLPLSEALQRWQSGRLRGACAALTFDDGYADNLHVAAPLLRERGVPATLFCTSAYFDGGAMWNDIVLEAFRHAPGPRLDLRALELGDYLLADIETRRTIAYDVLRHLKHLPYAERAQKVQRLGELAATPAYAPMLTRAELQQLPAYGFEIGGHTHSHPILSRLEPQEAAQEIRQNKTLLEGLLNTSITLFAYPNGKPAEDYQALHATQVEAAGYTAACSTSLGAVRGAAEVWQLPRLGLWPTEPRRCVKVLLGNQYTRPTCV